MAITSGAKLYDECLARIEAQMGMKRASPSPLPRAGTRVANLSSGGGGVGSKHGPASTLFNVTQTEQKVHDAEVDAADAAGRLLYKVAEEVREEYRYEKSDGTHAYAITRDAALAEACRREPAAASVYLHRGRGGF